MRAGWGIALAQLHGKQPIPRTIPFARFRQLVTGSASSVAVGFGLTYVLRIVSSMTLTRLLDSHAYGVIGVILTVSFMINMLADIGWLAFVVRHERGDEPQFLDELWTLRLIRGFGLTVAMALAAWPIALFLQKPELAPVIAVWGVSFLIDGLSSLAVATGVRAGQLWRLALMDVVASIGVFVVSIAAALVTRSYWAMVGGMIAGWLFRLVYSYVAFPGSRRRFAINRGISRELWTFSRAIAASSLLSIVVLETDKLVLARVLPLATYGLYAIAITLSSAPAGLAAAYATRVLFGSYAQSFRLDPGSVPLAYYATRRKVTLLYMFVVGGMIGAAPFIVKVLYDPRYDHVSFFLRIVGISTVLRMVNYAANEVLIATGRTRATLMANIFRVAWLVVGGAVGLWLGSVTILVVTIGTIEVPGMLSYWWDLRRAGILSLREESYGFVAALVGVGGGLGLNAVAHYLFARL